VALIVDDTSARAARAFASAPGREQRAPENRHNQQRALGARSERPAELVRRRAERSDARSVSEREARRNRRTNPLAPGERERRAGHEKRALRAETATSSSPAAN